MKDLTERLEDLQTCLDLIAKQGSLLTRALKDVESFEPGTPDIATKIKTASDRAAHFRIAASAMISVSLLDFKKFIILIFQFPYLAIS